MDKRINLPGLQRLPVPFSVMLQRSPGTGGNDPDLPLLQQYGSLPAFHPPAGTFSASA